MTSFCKLKESITISKQEICREILHKNRDAIKVKNETVAITNLMRIFEATLELSNQVGFQAMSVRELSKRTKLSMGALYSYVESKERLLCMLLQYGGALGHRSRQLPEHVSENARDRLLASIKLHIYLTEIYQSWFFFIYMQAKFFNKKTLARIVQEEEISEAYYQKILEDGCQAGEMKIDNTILTASSIIALLQDWYLKREKYRKLAVSAEQYADFVCDLITVKL